MLLMAQGCSKAVLPIASSWPSYPQTGTTKGMPVASWLPRIIPKQCYRWHMVGRLPDAADDLLMAQYHPEAVAFQLLFSWASLKLAQIGGATDSFGMAQLPSNEMLPIAWGGPLPDAGIGLATQLLMAWD